jgi:hypothetical protein
MRDVDEEEEEALGEGVVRQDARGPSWAPMYQKRSNDHASEVEKAKRSDSAQSKDRGLDKRLVSANIG